jgi:hypothetical protein
MVHPAQIALLHMIAARVPGGSGSGSTDAVADADPMSLNHDHAQGKE